MRLQLRKVSGENDVEFLIPTYNGFHLFRQPFGL